jgi:hypothetical protein
MPYTAGNVPDYVPKGKRGQWAAIWNSAYEKYGNEARAFMIANGSIKTEMPNNKLQIKKLNRAAFNRAIETQKAIKEIDSVLSRFENGVYEFTRGAGLTQWSAGAGDRYHAHMSRNAKTLGRMIKSVPTKWRKEIQQAQKIFEQMGQRHVTAKDFIKGIKKSRALLKPFIRSSLEDIMIFMGGGKSAGGMRTGTKASIRDLRSDLRKVLSYAKRLNDKRGLVKPGEINKLASLLSRVAGHPVLRRYPKYDRAAIVGLPGKLRKDWAESITDGERARVAPNHYRNLAFLVEELDNYLLDKEKEKKEARFRHQMGYSKSAGDSVKIGSVRIVEKLVGPPYQVTVHFDKVGRSLVRNLSRTSQFPIEIVIYSGENGSKYYKFRDKDALLDWFNRIGYKSMKQLMWIEKTREGVKMTPVKKAKR